MEPSDLTIETEQGEVVDSLNIYIGQLIRIIDKLPEVELSTTHCLQYIDPYGDTVFNCLQKQRLALELKNLSNKLSGGIEAENLARVIDMVERYKDKVGMCIKFHGD